MRLGSALRFPLLFLTLACGAQTIRIDVDARDVPRNIFRAHLTIPARPGPLTLLYPQWIPGEHGPTGPIANLTGLELRAGGKRIPWKRDLVNMFAFHCEIPQGAAALDVSLEFLSSPETRGFSSGGSTSDKLGVISWNQVLLYPEGPAVSELTYQPSLRLPAGWKFGTALPVRRASGDTVEFAPAPLDALVDSPVLCGEFLRVVPLTAPGVTPPLEIDMAADSAAALAIPGAAVKAYEQLVSQAFALFGSRHYRDYHFLLTLSNHVAHFGLEHHESSDDRVDERTMIDDQMRRDAAGLLPHEFVHSWNGKYRRPADLTTPNYSVPMKTDLLWVYEGLTTYLGNILTARSGLWSPEQFREDLARSAAFLSYEPGRDWRSLEDTAVAAQLLYDAPPAWESWRRGVDFYNEAALLWLEADTVIRRQTEGKRSLDDFCRAFFGGPGGPPKVVTYTFDDLVSALNSICPYDWRAFWAERLNRTGGGAPLGGVEAGGWRLAFTDKPNEFGRGHDRAEGVTDLAYSIGLRLADDGIVVDAIQGSPAARAGLAPGMKLEAIDGRRFTADVMRDAIQAAVKTGTIEIEADNHTYLKNYAVAYAGGPRHPHLQRVDGTPDLLSEILKPLN